MKKRVLSLFFAVVTGCALTACGGAEPSAQAAPESSKQAVQESAESVGAAGNSDAESKPEPQTEPSDSGSKILVAYFSRADENYNVGTIEKGNTQIIAEYIASEIGADMFHIETVTPYPASYKECCDAAKQELADKARPEITGNVDLSQYDTVFLGYPIWWGDLPMAVYTFMERYDWSGKTVIPFNTHEGSGTAGTYDKIAATLSGVTMRDGMAMQGKTAQAFSGSAKQTVREWLDGLGY